MHKEMRREGDHNDGTRRDDLHSKKSVKELPTTQKTAGKDEYTTVYLCTVRIHSFCSSERKDSMDLDRREHKIDIYFYYSR